MLFSLRRWLLPALLVAAWIVPSAAAQDLAELAPPAAILTLDVERPADVGDDLLSDLADLGWDEAKDTLERVFRLVGDDTLDAFDRDLLGMLRGPGPGDELAAELRAECPDLPPGLAPFELLDAGLVTLAMTSMQPFPTVTAIARVRPEAASAAADLHDTLVGCFADARMQQDGIELHVMADGSDLPVVVARIDDVYVVATTPDAVRGVIRRATGSDEPSLADRPLRQTTERFVGTGVGLMLDLTAMADIIEGFVGPGDTTTAEGYLQDRLLSAARTVGGFASRWGLSADGIVMESAVAVDPDGGDPALADLLLCSTCAVSRAFLAPAGSVAVASQHVPVRGIFAYLQGVLDGVADVTGEDLDLRDLVQEAFGLDLDAALLDWAGSEVHLVQLEAFEPGLGPLIYGVPTVALMPVASPDAARQGLAMLADALAPLANEPLADGRWMGSRTPFLPGGDLLDLPEASPGQGWIATRSFTYRDVDVQRIQVGPVVDLGIALVGNHLVVGHPSHAVEDVIDTFRGVQAALDSPAYRRARGGAPAGAPYVMVQDVSAELAGYADLGDILAQPAASLLAVAIQEASEPESARPTEAPVPVDERVSWSEVPVTIEGELTPSNVNEFGEPADRFLLTGVPSGERVRVTLSSDAFDTYLYLLEPSGDILDSNDDADFDTDSALAFVSSGADVVIEATSFGGGDSGPYVLRIERGSIADLPQIDLAGVTPTPLQAPGTVAGVLADDDRLPGGDIGRTYALQGLQPGQQVEVEVVSEAFDTYLRIVQPDAGVVLAENDDAPDTSRSAATVFASGAPLWVQVTSWSGSSTGPFDLRVGVTAAPAMAESSTTPPGDGAASDAPDVEEPDADVEPPSFVDLLRLVEIVPRALDVLAERVGIAHGYGEVDGRVIYRRTVIEVAW